MGSNPHHPMPPVEYHYGKFPPPALDWAAIVPLIEPATLAIGEFKGLLDAIPNSHILLSPLTTQEAVLSSRIEGTVATMGEVLDPSTLSSTAMTAWDA